MVDKLCDKIYSRAMRVLVYGDFTLDRYTSVTTYRDCPEKAGAPVYDVVSSHEYLGCAGNVWTNVNNLRHIVDQKLDIDVGGCMGWKMWDRVLNGRWSMVGSDYLHLGNDITKDRLVIGDSIQCRVDSHRDFGKKTPLSSKRFDEHATRYDLSIISDYCFGGVDADVCAEIIANSTVSVVDSKRSDLSMFTGTTAFKFNQREYQQHMSSSIPSKWVVVTKGDKGCRVIEGNNDGIPIAQASAWDDVSERDVTGCGDTFTAAFALMLASGRGVDSAAYGANYLASRVVTRMGPSVPTPDEIEEGKRRGVL
jgi:bifunctional ADP-heptose synthase (sugar kinase/adenylyltransferase)